MGCHIWCLKRDGLPNTGEANAGMASDFSFRTGRDRLGLGPDRVREAVLGVEQLDQRILADLHALGGQRFVPWLLEHVFGLVVLVDNEPHAQVAAGAELSRATARRTPSSRGWWP